MKGSLLSLRHCIEQSSKVPDVPRQPFIQIALSPSLLDSCLDDIITGIMTAWFCGHLPQLMSEISITSMNNYKHIYGACSQARPRRIVRRADEPASVQIHTGGSTLISQSVNAPGCHRMYLTRAQMLKRKITGI